MSFENPDPISSALELSNKYSLSSKNVVSSAYWKVPDQKAHLTAVACHDTDPLVAVASGTRDSNLFIYEVNAPQDDRFYPPQSDGYYNYPTNFGDDDTFETPKKHRNSRKSQKHLRSVSGTSFGSTSTTSLVSTSSQYSSPVLTHHQTISLGGIHSLAWVLPQHQMGSFGNVLATGHNSGLVHMVLLPDPYANNGPAEILTRFNHARHISTNLISSSRIKHINLTSDAWSCCPQSSVVSMFSEHLFMWDPARGDKPIIIQRTRHARSHHISPKRNGIVALATDRGISIMDLRYKNPSALAPPHENDGYVSLVKWSSLDENRVASVHDQTVMKIWDIRTGSPLVTLEGHYDRINSIEWSLTSTNEFYSASSDGTVRLWDINKCSENARIPLKKRSRSVPCFKAAKAANPDSSLDWLPSKSWKLYRQRLARGNNMPSYNYFLDNQNPQSPCTTIFSNNREFLSLGLVKMPSHSGYDATSEPHLVSIDNSGFFGIHSKIPQTMEDAYSVPYVSTKDSAARISMDSLASTSTNSGQDLDQKLDFSDDSRSPSPVRRQRRMSSREYQYQLGGSQQQQQQQPATPRRCHSYGADKAKASGFYGAAESPTKPLNIAPRQSCNDEYMASKLKKSAMRQRKSMPDLVLKKKLDSFDFTA